MMNLAKYPSHINQHLVVLKSGNDQWKARSLEKGENVVSAQRFKKIYCIKEGIVMCFAFSDDGKSIVKNLFYPGDYFGEEALQALATNENQYHVLSNKAVVEEISVYEFQNIVRENPQFFISFFQQVMERNQRMEKIMERNLSLKAEQRVQSVLKELILKAGKKMLNGEYVLRQNLQHQEMATIANTTRQMVSSLLNLWRTKGQLTYDRSQIIIRNPQFLI